LLSNEATLPGLQYRVCNEPGQILLANCLAVWYYKSYRVWEVMIVKQAIHPDYKSVMVTCACGEQFETGSVKQNLRVEVCSKCHPFFTGKQKFIDVGGRVDRFKKKYGM